MTSHELNYVRHPWRSRLMWAGFYGTLLVSCVIGLLVLAGHIRTHTLPVGQVDLSVPYSKYLLGEPVSFTITNNFNSPIFSVNHCPDEPLGIYKLVNDKWVRIHAKAVKDCDDNDRRISIPPHSTQTVSLAPWASLFSTAGKYRLVVFVEYYNALPYQDIEIINPPVSAPATSNSPSSNGQPAGGTGSQPTQSDNEEEDESATNPVTHTIQVNSSGNYSITSLTMHRGDSIRFVYSPPIQNEVRTVFTVIATGSPPVSSLTLDQEHSSGVRTFNSVGTWRFKADDRSGNTGTVVVQ